MLVHLLLVRRVVDPDRDVLAAGGTVDRRADAPVHAAAADVALHRAVDGGVVGVRVGVEQGDGGHDLAGLAVAALRDLLVDPGLLDRMQAVVPGDALDRGDLAAGGRGDGRHAAADRGAVEMHNPKTPKPQNP